MGKYLTIIIGVCIALMGLSYGLYSKNPEAYNLTMLLASDIILAGLSIIAYIMTNNALKQTNPNAFIRAKMGSTMLRLFICVAGIGTFAYLNGKAPDSKPTIFLILGMYVIYTIVESAVLSKKGRIGK
jgi:hypothetical protein